MVRKKAIKDASFLDNSTDQHKDFDHRLNLIETTLKSTAASIQNLDASNQNMAALIQSTVASVQKIEAWIAENKESTDGRRDLKQGFLRATFNISNFPGSGKGGFESKSVAFAGAKWHLAVYKEKVKNEQALGAYLVFEPGSSIISYDVDLTIRLVGSPKSIEKQINKCYSDEKYAFGFLYLVSWTRLTNFTNGFVDGKGNFEVQVIFSVMGKTSTNALLDVQFLTSGFVSPDCILLVENRHFPVNKGFLSSFSSYFKTLFFGNFCEKNQEEIELKDVCAVEFLHLLEAIYPSVDIEASNENLMRDSVECLLRLADCYQVDIVTKRCEAYLKKCPVSEVALEVKIVYAQDYRLLGLLEQCIKAYKTVDDVKKLRQTSQYSDLTQKTQLLIHENITRSVENITRSVEDITRSAEFDVFGGNLF